jgi:hypothetical protein
LPGSVVLADTDDMARRSDDMAFYPGAGSTKIAAATKPAARASASARPGDVPRMAATP